MLTCTRCQSAKDPEAFHLDARRASGRTAQCKECRSQTGNAHKYRQPCVNCGHHRRLDRNLWCPRCNAARGLRECKECRLVLPALLSFYPERAVCKECLKERRAGSRTADPAQA